MIIRLLDLHGLKLEFWMHAIEPLWCHAYFHLGPTQTCRLVVRASVWGVGDSSSFPDHLTYTKDVKSVRLALLGLALDTNKLDSRMAGSESV